MTKTERVKEARAQLAAAQAKVATMEKANAEHDTKQKVAFAKKSLVRKRAQRRHIAIQRPGETVLLPGGLPTNRAYTDAELLKQLGTNTRKWEEAVAAGACSISVGTVAMKAKGFSAKARYISPANLRTIRAAERRVTVAQAALTKAHEAKRMAILAAWVAGEKVPVEDVAKSVAACSAIEASVPRSFDSWQLDSARRDVNLATAHLDFVMGKASECNCLVCFDEREKVKFAEQRKALDAAPRVRFTCPSHGHDIITIVRKDRDGNDIVRGCGYVDYLVAAVKPRKAPKGSPLGIVEDEAA